MRLQGKSIAILIAEGVEDYEYFVPTDALAGRGREDIVCGDGPKTL